MSQQLGAGTLANTGRYKKLPLSRLSPSTTDGTTLLPLFICCRLTVLHTVAGSAPASVFSGRAGGGREGGRAPPSSISSAVPPPSIASNISHFPSTERLIPPPPLPPPPPPRLDLVVVVVVVGGCHARAQRGQLKEGGGAEMKKGGLGGDEPAGMSAPIGLDGYD
ncbi:unnamed protein product [Pleuronectes platessa]|uniref:Uncharacterized protein n=1 Tax=Pleuronectes platessa TaxID=8262 RepID=A0A9N7VLW1_PLEPL|nr:unnamed protein product [Pleuronectes platessa]